MIRLCCTASGPSHQLALEKTQSIQEKAFAQQMIKDHTKADRHLLDLARQPGFSVPDDAALASKARKMMLQVQDMAKQLQNAHCKN